MYLYPSVAQMRPISPGKLYVTVTFSMWLKMAAHTCMYMYMYMYMYQASFQRLNVSYQVVCQARPFLALVL